MKKPSDWMTEAERATALKTVYPNAHSIYMGEEYLEIDEADGEEIRTIDADLTYGWFPSAGIGERVTIDDIIGEPELI